MAGPGPATLAATTLVRRHRGRGTGGADLMFLDAEPLDQLLRAFWCQVGRDTHSSCRSIRQAALDYLGSDGFIRDAGLMLPDVTTAWIRERLETRFEGGSV